MRAGVERLSDRPETLVVPSTSAPSGLVTYLLGIARLELSLPPAFVAVPGSELATRLDDDIEVIPSGPSRSELTRTLRSEGRRFTAIETHGARALAAARAAAVPPRRHRHVFHETVASMGARGVGERALAAGLAKFANSEAVAANVGVRHGTVEVLPPVAWLPDELLDRDSAREALGLPARTVVVAVIGRLSPAKRPELAVEAVAEVAAEHGRAVYLAFVGAGPSAPVLRSRAAELGVELTLLGEVAAAAASVRAFDAVVGTSPEESFGLALAEAILAEVPVAAVASPGARGLTDDGRLLELAEPHPSALARAILAALDSPPERLVALKAHVAERHGEAARRPLYERHYGAAQLPTR
jgi:glycosyltransferase involved in cell wall biosynthesis